VSDLSDVIPSITAEKKKRTSLNTEIRTVRRLGCPVAKVMNARHRKVVTDKPDRYS
jgi:hypothetical protein